MIQGLILLENALGIPLPLIILIGTLVPTILFYVVDSRIGLMISFIIASLNILLTYKLDITYIAYPVIITLMLVVMLAFSLYNSSKMSTGGGKLT